MENNDRTIRVAIVDDHPMVREGLRMFLELAKDVEIVGTANSGQSAVQLVSTTAVDVILMDLLMPGEISGMEAIRQIQVVRPETRILVLSSSQSTDDMRQSLSLGAVGYLQKDVQPDELVSAIRQAAAGRGVLEAAALEALRQVRSQTPPASEPHSPTQAHPPQPAIPNPLTPREQSVLELLAGGMANKEIADSLDISEKTVKVHISHIFGKLSVYDRTQAVVMASRMGLVTL